MRLTLVNASMGGGGAERAMAAMANHWASEGETITLITLASKAVDCQPLHAGICRVALDLVAVSSNPVQAIYRNLRRLASLERAIRGSRPDAVISFLPETNLLTLATAGRTGAVVIVAERIDPRQEPVGIFRGALRRVLYPRADAVVVQTADVASWATGFIPAERVHVIPNFVTAPRHDGTVAPPSWLPVSGRTVCAMGRLTRQKGFDLLLQAFARCIEDRRGWSLVILGEGEERSRLEALADSLGIGSKVSMPGYVSGAAAELRHAELFVLPSRYEGFPNALIEALAAGVPVIAADCPSGPRDIVRHGVDGFLVPCGDVPALVAAITFLMDAPEVRGSMRARAPEVADRFAASAIMRQWENLLSQCSVRRRGAFANSPARRGGHHG